jgi:hypothetical protein
MKRENKILWEILVPTIKDGKPVRTKYHKVWDEKVRAISNGLTILKPAKGEWVSSSGELFAERMIPVRIACSEVDIEVIMDMTIKYYNQEEVLAYKISECVKFMKADDFGHGLGMMKTETDRLKKHKELV